MLRRLLAVSAAIACAALVLAVPASAATPPDTLVSAPTQNQVLTRTPVVISGSATDDVGVAQVRVAIQHTVTKQWWNGTTWGQFTAMNATLASPGATSTAWTFSWNVPGDSIYLAQVDSRDTEGLIDPSRANRTFQVSGVGLPPQPPTTPVPVRTIGGTGHAGLYGWGATTMRDGTVLIGDYWNYRVTQWNTDGTPVGDGVLISNRGDGPTQHQPPYGLGVDPRNGDVYLADADKHTVDVYTEAGAFKRTWGSAATLKYPSRVAITSTGRIFVVDTDAHRILAYNDAGTKLWQFGSLGAGNKQFRDPHGISLDAADNFYVADTNNQRVMVYDVNGNFLRKWGSRGSNEGQFEGDMRGLAVDKVNGFVYVSDGVGNRINKFTLAGQFVTRWGSEGTGPGQFSDGGREVTVDKDGNVWVGDMPNFRAQKFSPTGAFLLQVPGVTVPPPAGGFNSPRGASVGPDGSVYVSDTYNWRVQKFDATGAFSAQWGSRGQGPYRLNYTRMIASDMRNGDVVVTDTDNHLLKKYDQNGVFKWDSGGRGTGAGQFMNPHGVEIGPDGRIYVTDTNNDRIQVLDENGNHLLTFGAAGTGNGQFQNPRGITLDELGQIYVTDSVRDVVQVFSNAGQYIRTFASKGAADNQLTEAFDVAVANGLVYVADPPKHKVKIWTTSGVFVAAFGGLGTTLGKMNKPQGLDIHNGQLYVTENENERVQVFTL